MLISINNIYSVYIYSFRALILRCPLVCAWLSNGQKHVSAESSRCGNPNNSLQHPKGGNNTSAHNHGEITRSLSPLHVWLQQLDKPSREALLNPHPVNVFSDPASRQPVPWGRRGAGQGLLLELDEIMVTEREFNSSLGMCDVFIQMYERDRGY